MEVKDLKVSFFTPAGEVKAVGAFPMIWIMVRSWEWLESPDPEKARRLIPLLVFFSHQVRLLAEALL